MPDDSDYKKSSESTAKSIDPQKTETGNSVDPRYSKESSRSGKKKLFCAGILVGFVIAIVMLFAGIIWWLNSMHSEGKKHSPPLLSREDEKFFNDVADIIGNVGGRLYEISADNLGARLDEIRLFEKFIHNKEGHKFESGAVLRENSSLHIFALTWYISEFDSAGECDKVYDLLEDFMGMVSSDYLIVDIFTKEIVDPVYDEDIYAVKKSEDTEQMISRIKYLDCYECEIQPGPDWYPDEACYPDGSDEFSID